jgi:hypothetical protein
VINSLYNDIKVYQINLDFFEFKDYKADLIEIVNHIISYHKTNFKTEFDLSYSEDEFQLDECNYHLYTFNEKEKESIWKDFFPQELVKDREFLIKSTSFVLFIKIDKRVFCIIGGKGISVIKRFINNSFGLDFYEKVAEPVNDIVFSQVSRGVSGNLTSEQITYRNEQKLQDILAIGRVPKKINLQLRKDLKDTLFDFIDFEDTENIYLEIGSSFCLKWKINFSQLHELIIKLNEVLNVTGTKSLSRFERITDDEFISSNLQPALLEQLRDDMVRLSTPNTNYGMLLDNDFVHPTKLNIFYECDAYKAFFKNGQNCFFETRDRTTLYSSILTNIYATILDPTDNFEFRKIISGVRIRGFVGETRKTEAMFVNHLTCELTTLSQPYFLIDNVWYKVKGDFINSINEQCSQLIKRNLLTPNPLDILWDIQELTEGDYNLLYIERPEYIILDKMLGENIELCDILFETEDTLYVIHVKDGFDAKIRDLTNQISISASRLWNDLKSDKTFLKSVYKSYSESTNNVRNLSWTDFLQKFTTKEIVYVLAFSSNLKDKTVSNNINSHKSNIAKFSVIQSFREQTSNYQIKVVEIKKLRTT